MKRILSIFSLLVLLVTVLVGCNDKQSNKRAVENTDKKLKVVATIFPQYDFIREIAGDNVELTMLLPPGVEVHSFEPTPKDIVTIQNCDIFIYVGGESDAWIEELLESMDTSNMEIISLTNLVETVEEEIVEGMEVEDMEEVELDEHVWTSPKNAIKIVQEISSKLCDLDRKNATTYGENATAYIEKLITLDKQLEDVVSAGNRKTLVFGDRFPLRYLADAYGLEYFAAFPGCSTETEASASTIAFLINKVKEEHIPVVYYIEFSNEKMADTICEEAGAKKMLLHSCHNITKNEFDNGVSYLDLMMQNVKSLKEGLQ